MSFLDNVPEENVFVLSNGARVHNLEELLNALASSEESLFYNHVTPDRNDFANWIKYVIHHEELYEKIIGIKDRKQFINILGTEIDYIKIPKLKETAAFFSENPNVDQAKTISQPKIEVPNQVSNTIQHNTPVIPTPASVTPSVASSPVLVTTPISSPVSTPFSKSANTPDQISSQIPSKVQDSASNTAADMFKPVADTPPSKNSGGSPNISLASSESNNSVDSNVAFSDFEQVLSVIITEINNEILSWNEQNRK